jgi:antitoxin VapB
MGLNIKNPETCEPAKELAELTGESMTTAITKALAERLLRVRRERQEAHRARTEEVMAIVREFGGGHGYSSQDIDRLLYDEHGLPK